MSHTGCAFFQPHIKLKVWIVVFRANQGPSSLREGARLSLGSLTGLALIGFRKPSPAQPRMSIPQTPKESKEGNAEKEESKLFRVIFPLIVKPFTDRHLTDQNYHKIIHCTGEANVTTSTNKSQYPLCGRK